MALAESSAENEILFLRTPNSVLELNILREDDKNITKPMGHLSKKDFWFSKALLNLYIPCICILCIAF